MDTTPRLALGIALSLCMAACLQPRREAAPIPESWTPYRGELTETASSEARCAATLGTAWQIREAHGEVWVEEVSLSPVDARRSPLPYPIVPSADMLDSHPPPAPPPPPGYGGKLPVDPGDGARQYENWARRYIEDSARRVVFKVADGWLLGIDGGEFGGSLWWYPTRPGPGKKLWEGNVISFYEGRTPNEVVVLTGLAHMSIDEGKVLLATRDGDRGWVVAEGPDLGSEPRASSQQDDHSLLIATASRILRYKPPATVQHVASVQFPARPFSVLARSSGDILVGQSFFVLSLSSTESGYVPQWYVPSRCAKYLQSQYRCVCSG